MEEKILKLTNAVYKVLEFFPESDPIKHRAKDKALFIMENVSSLMGVSGWASFQNEKTKLQIADDIDILLGYLWIAKTQGWLNSMNYLIISNEYEKIRKNIKPYVDFKKIPEPQPEAESNVQKLTAVKKWTEEKLADKQVALAEQVSPAKQVAPIKQVALTDRQEKIINYLGKNSKAQVMDLQKVLPKITKRTIRRDLDDLLKSKRIIRMGEFNQVFYKISG
jgi:hypothetical protein